MDSQIETSEIQIEERKPLTADELHAEIKSLDGPIDELWERNATHEEREAKRQQVLKEFVEKQVKEKDRFGNIFRTQKGSYYFTLASGESLRVKQLEDGLKMQPMCRKIFYVDSQQGEDLVAMLKRYDFQEAIIGTPIKTVPCDIGLMPVEFGISGMPEIHFKEEPGKIIIEGDNTGVFASGYHQGHPITEIIK